VQDKLNRKNKLSKCKVPADSSDNGSDNKQLLHVIMCSESGVKTPVLKKLHSDVHSKHTLYMLTSSSYYLEMLKWLENSDNNKSLLESQGVNNNNRFI
jgi:hypothetical protein